MNLTPSIITVSILLITTASYFKFNLNLAIYYLYNTNILKSYNIINIFIIFVTNLKIKNMLAFLLSMFIAYEIQKLFQFKLFFKLKCLVTDHEKKLKEKVPSVIATRIVKIALIDMLYLIILVISLFSYNYLFASIILFLSVLQNLLYRHVKNNRIRKIAFITDSILSIIVLTLFVINILFYNMDSLQLIKHLLTF